MEGGGNEGVLTVSEGSFVFSPGWKQHNKGALSGLAWSG